MPASHGVTARSRLTSLLSATLLMAGQWAAADPAEGVSAGRYTFGRWTLSQEELEPRGGSTRGMPVQPAFGPNPAWVALQEAGLSARERDRLAILAMAGSYETRFEFLETVAAQPGYSYDRPYQSWGTELILVIADRPEFISLQHILVMYFQDADGAVQGPLVTKHWRQDWTYQDNDLHQFIGYATWRRTRLSPAAVAGAWSQAVYQVDDSPRYEAIGRWTHRGNLSYWEGAETWRPLPRREFSVRSDYDALSGRNRHSITPDGWTHEQDNLKLVLAGPGIAAEAPILSREIGLNRYRLITGTDFQPGRAYWQQTHRYWQYVREAWQQVYAQYDRFTISKEVDGKKLFEHHFELAGELQTQPLPDAELRRRAESIVHAFLKNAQAAGSVDD